MELLSDRSVKDAISSKISYISHYAVNPQKDLLKFFFPNVFFYIDILFSEFNIIVIVIAIVILFSQSRVAFVITM